MTRRIATYSVYMIFGALFGALCAFCDVHAPEGPETPTIEIRSETEQERWQRCVNEIREYGDKEGRPDYLNCFLQSYDDVTQWDSLSNEEKKYI